MSLYTHKVHLLERYLQKDAAEFTIDDIVKYVYEKDIEMVNLRYVAEDGKLKTMNFVVSGEQELKELLTNGDRVDGAGIFSFLKGADTDLYLIPRCETAFVHPFCEIPSLEILCSFYTWEGEPLESSPEAILMNAYALFTEETKLDLKFFGELEFYIISKIEEHLPHANAYQSSAPFAKFEVLRKEALRLIAMCGGKVRFGHVEKGAFVYQGKYYEQQEIEFLPESPQNAVEQLIIAKWILRMLGDKYGVELTFIPKILPNYQGSGLHMHMKVEQNGINLMLEDGKISSLAKKLISGILDLSPSLTAFCNTIPISFLRLAPGQNVPNQVCWGIANRSALIRVPKQGKIRTLPFGKEEEKPSLLFSYEQTIEYRASDASANLYFFVAGMILACLFGLSNDEGLQEASDYYTSNNLFSDDIPDDENTFNSLPNSCFQASGQLDKHKSFYTERYPVFPKVVIEHLIRKLKAYNDQNLIDNTDLYGINNDEMQQLIEQYVHYM